LDVGWPSMGPQLNAAEDRSGARLVETSAFAFNGAAAERCGRPGPHAPEVPQTTPSMGPQLNAAEDLTAAGLPTSCCGTFNGAAAERCGRRRVARRGRGPQ